MPQDAANRPKPTWLPSFQPARTQPTASPASPRGSAVVQQDAAAPIPFGQPCKRSQPTSNGDHQQAAKASNRCDIHYSNNPTHICTGKPMQNVAGDQRRPGQDKENAPPPVTAVHGCPEGSKAQSSMAAKDAPVTRAVKVHDNVRSIIPAHKGKEITYDQRVLGSFGIDLRDKIGEGVYAKVKLGVDLFSGKPEDQSKFAIKIIDKEKVTSRFIDNFLNRELSVWSKLSHPGITQFYYYTVTPKKVYMVLEYLPGGDLLTHVQNLKALPDKPQVQSWSWQLVSAVEYIHSLGAAHRDIKLENILMDTTATKLKLTDFGFSTDEASRMSTTFCGSKAYAAPELIKAVPYSPQAVDIWALGCVLFVFINGIMAFDETVEQSVLLYNQRNRVYIWRNPRNHSPNAKRTVESMLTCDWKLRPTAAALRNDPWIRSGSLHSRNGAAA